MSGGPRVAQTAAGCVDAQLATATVRTSGVLPRRFLVSACCCLREAQMMSTHSFLFSLFAFPVCSFLAGLICPRDPCASRTRETSCPSTPHISCQAYASGRSLVILDAHLTRLQVTRVLFPHRPSAFLSFFFCSFTSQVIEGDGELACVSASLYTGVISVASGSEVRLYAPQTHAADVDFPVRWQLVSSFDNGSEVRRLAWSHAGDFCLVAGISLSLYRFARQGDYGSLHRAWSTLLASPVHFLRVSPDDRLFVTAAESDCLPKVWFPSDEQLSPDSLDLMCYDFVYLPHPGHVASVSWRQTGQAPKGSAAAAEEVS
jgi:hypothetical protein